MLEGLIIAGLDRSVGGEIAKLRVLQLSCYLIGCMDMTYKLQCDMSSDEICTF
jgi:hypothetical protein